MGYKMPLVTKEIYLPLSDGELVDGITLEEYQEKYGIDLKPFIKLDTFNKTISCDFGFSKIYIVNADWNVYFCTNVFSYILVNSTQNWIEGEQGAYIILFFDESHEYGFELLIPRDDDFKIENVRVVAFEA